MDDSRITLKKKPLTVTGTAKQKAEIAMVNLAGHARSQMHFMKACGVAMSECRMLSDAYS